MENGRDQESWKTEIDGGIRKERIGTGSKEKRRRKVKSQRGQRSRRGQRSK